MNIIFKSKLSELEDETLISSVIFEWAVPLRETEVADSHRKSSVWPLQFGLSLYPLLLTEENPQSPDSDGFQTALRVDKYCVVRYCSTRDVELENQRRQLALSAIMASQSRHPSPHGHLVALLKIYPWKDTGFTVTAAAGYSGDLLRSLNLGAHMSDHPKGCL